METILCNVNRIIPLHKQQTKVFNLQEIFILSS